MSANKTIIITAVILMSFAIISATLVGVTHEQTKEKIRFNERLMLLKKLNTILPASSYDNDLLSSTIVLEPDLLLGTKLESTAYIARKQNKPIAIVLPATAPNGYNGPIDLLVGIRYDGTLAGTRVVKHRETPGLGDVLEEQKSDWILGFENKSLNNPDTKKWKVKKDGGFFDQFTGATITPRAVVKAIHATLLYFDQHKKTLFGISDKNPIDDKPKDQNHNDTTKQNS